MVWLGGQDMFQLNQWEWMDNSNFTYKNWSPGNPLNATNYMCLALGITNGYWTSVDCSATLPFVCEFAPSA
uniref:C-type lectin domain-containing protein n=1 Tax=Acrobeloides nanus TaxID=290746 RepID=A0A914EIP9_9BILA